MTDSTAGLIKSALQGIRAIYRDGYLYKKAGVLLTGLVPASQTQVVVSRENGRRIFIDVPQHALHSGMNCHLFRRKSGVRAEEDPAEEQIASDRTFADKPSLTWAGRWRNDLDDQEADEDRVVLVSR